ncbi:MAG TPA: hypothetical protein VJ978_05955 [Nitriliruptoraceae bacterium]|nr:hypothetical protein [Nitriliruptoraceae bacterium]
MHAQPALPSDAATTTQQLTADYELMENYLLASRVTAGTEIALAGSASTAPGGDHAMDVFTLDAVNAIVWHNRFDPGSDTGWTAAPLPSLTNTTITSMAAILAPTGQQVVVVGTSTAVVYGIQSTDAAAGTWPSNWSMLAPRQTFTLAGTVHRVLLDSDGATVTLVTCDVNLRFPSAPEQPDVANGYGVTMGPLDPDSMTWTPDSWPPPSGSAGSPPVTTIESDSCMVATSLDDQTMTVVGMVTPKLVVYPVPASGTWPEGKGSPWADSALYDAHDASYYKKQGIEVGVWRAVPFNPEDMVLGDVATTVKETPPTTGMVAGQIVDPTDTQPAPLVGCTQLEWLWNSSGTGASNTIQMMSITPPDEGYTSQGWMATNQSYKTCKDGLDGPSLTDRGVTVKVGVVRSDLLDGVVAADTTNVFTTVAGHGDPMWIDIMHDGYGNEIGNLAASVDADQPTYAFVQQGVHPGPSMLFTSDGSAAPTALPGSNLQSFTNWCRSDGGAQAAVDAAGTLWLLPVGASAWVQVPGSRDCQAWTATTNATLAACDDLSGTTHVFAVTTDQNLVHVTMSSNATVAEPLQIATEIESVYCAPTVSGEGESSGPRIFAVTMGQSASTPPGVVFMVLGEQDWISQPVQDGADPDDAAGASLQPVSSYTCHLSTSTTDGSKPSLDLSIAVSDPCALVINGVAHRVLPGEPHVTSSNSVGVVHLVTVASDLTAPTLTITPVDDENEPLGDPLPVVPNSKVVAALAACTEQRMLDATDAAGQALLTDGDTAAAMADAMVALATLATTQSDALQRAVAPGVPTLFDAATHPPAATTTDLPQSWSISFAAGQPPVFAPLPADEVLARAREMSESLPHFTGAGSTLAAAWSDVMSVVKTVGSAIVECSVAFLEGGGVQVSLQLVLDGVDWFYQATVAAADCLKIALDLVGGLFEQVAVVVERVVEWLAYLFNWADIKATQQVVVAVFDTFFDLAAATVSQSQRFIDTQLAGLESALDAVWSTIETDLTGTPASMSAMSAPVPAQLLTAGLGNHQATNASSLVTTNTAIEATKAKIEGVAHPDPSSLDTSTWDDIATIADATLIATLEQVKDLLAGAIGVVKGVCDQVLEALGDIIDQLQAWFDAEIDMPWISDLYELVMPGEAMTLSGMVGLFTAVPGTVIYKLGNGGQAPFTATTASQFVDDYTVDVITGTWFPGGVPGAADMTDVAAGPGLTALEGLSDDQINNFRIAGGVLSVVPAAVGPFLGTAIDGYAALSAASGATTAIGVALPLSLASIGMSTVALGGSICGAIATGAGMSPPNPTWITFTALKGVTDSLHLLSDIVGASLSGCTTRLLTDAGIVIDCGYVMASSACGLVASIAVNDADLISLAVLRGLMGFLRLGLTSPVSVATESGSPWVVMGLELLMDGAEAIAIFDALVHPSDQGALAAAGSMG